MRDFAQSLVSAKCCNLMHTAPRFCKAPHARLAQTVRAEPSQTRFVANVAKPVCDPAGENGLPVSVTKKFKCLPLLGMASIASYNSGKIGNCNGAPVFCCRTCNMPSRTCC